MYADLCIDAGETTPRTKRTMQMEMFAQTRKMQDRITAARGECARYFWHSVAGLFARRA